MTTETLLRSARLPGDGRLVDLLLRDGRVAAVASSGELAALSVRELDGRWVVPGLWDNHTHFSQWAMTARRLDVSSAGSAREAAELVAARIAHDPGATDTLIGYGFRDGLWPDEPTTAVLDAAAAGRPVVLVSGDLHCAWTTSSAQSRYGCAPNDGLLLEDDCFRLVGLLGAVDDAVLDDWAADAAAAAARRGVVGVVDLEMRWNPGDWARRAALAPLSVRVETGVYAVDLERAISEGLRSADAIDASGLVTMGPLKVITDGSLNTRTAYCVDAYDGMSGAHAHGMLTVVPAELDVLLARAAAAGIRPTVHAIGDEANTLALDALARVGGGRIEHAQLVAAADLPRFAELGVVASVQPEHAVDDRDVADRYWHGRTDRAFPLRSLLDAGATLALGSDAPVAPLDPWIAIAAAVGRARGADAPWHPEQRITAAEALAASVRPNTGPVAGAIADLAIVDLDALTASAAELRSMPVAATLLAGRFTWDTLA
ncbi:amidohydrolase family protein [Microbacteriaceae bacterium VKM Ac-2854]|nr:amidohydrolase family protein [Microbacteriaceae bacterium VKM Ac-2854]